jgi:hypothetical protein
VHNTGGNTLFNFLADCLIGDFPIANMTRPTKIKLLIKSVEEGGIINYTAQSGFIYLLSRPEKVYSTGSTKVRYSFIIPKDHFTNVSLGLNNELGLGLYADDATEKNPENFAAYCSLKDIQQMLTGAANNLIVDWELIISNNSAN